MTPSFAVIAATLAASTVAVAQPVLHPDATSCRVDIVAAPADVRAEIESWVIAEPRCRVPLELRVVPIEGGYRLSARDRDGGVRVRAVPDARSAAALVASWIADDTIVAAVDDEVAIDPAPVVAAPAPVAEAHDLETPFLVRRARDLAAPPSGHWLVLGALGSDGVFGARGQVDVLRRGHWLAGVAGVVRSRADRDPGASHTASDLMAYFGASVALGRVELRAQLALGAELATSAGDDRMTTPRASSVVPHAELSVLAGVPLVGAWGLVGGPVVEASRGSTPALGVFVGMRRGL